MILWKNVLLEKVNIMLIIEVQLSGLMFLGEQEGLVKLVGKRLRL
jgi:hypothetical protein